MIRRALEKSGQVQVRAAELLGITKSLLQYKLKKYHLTTCKVGTLAHGNSALEGAEMAPASCRCQRTGWLSLPATHLIRAFHRRTQREHRETPDNFPEDIRPHLIPSPDGRPGVPLPGVRGRIRHHRAALHLPQVPGPVFAGG